MAEKLAEPRTVCVKCKWHNRSERQSQHWADQRCTHPVVQREPGFDPVFGQPAFYAVGQPHMGSGCNCQSPYCTEINTVGECPYYKPTVMVRVVGKLRGKSR